MREKIDWVKVKDEFGTVQEYDAACNLALVCALIFLLSTMYGMSGNHSLIVILGAFCILASLLFSGYFSFKKCQSSVFYRRMLLLAKPHTEIPPERYKDLIESAQTLCDGGETWMQDEICRLMKENGFVTEFEEGYLLHIAADCLDRLKQNKARTETILFCQAGRNPA